jgi:hypothetical protein
VTEVHEVREKTSKAVKKTIGFQMSFDSFRETMKNENFIGTSCKRACINRNGAESINNAGSSGTLGKTL